MLKMGVDLPDSPIMGVWGRKTARRNEGEYIDVAGEDCYNVPMNSVSLSGGAEMGKRWCKGK
jgi:hypothetical protein